MVSSAPASRASSTPFSSAASALPDPSVGTRICLNTARPSLVEREVAEKERDLREEDQKHRDAEQDGDEGRRPAHDVHVGAFEDRDGREDIATERRRGRADGDLQGDDRADEHRFETHGVDPRREDWHENEDHHDRVDEHAADEERDEMTKSTPMGPIWSIPTA